MTRQLSGFADWLRDNGAQVLDPTNAYEVLRYKLQGATHVIYQNKAGRLTITDAINAHIKAFEGGASGPVSRPTGKRRAAIIDTLLIRDGESCAICGDFLGDDITVEHFLPRDAGGSNDKRNLALAHQRCNSAVGNMAVIQKIAVREACLDQRNTVPPWEFVDVSAALSAVQRRAST
jgi:hypothetical protein